MSLVSGPQNPESRWWYRAGQVALLMEQSEEASMVGDKDTAILRLKEAQRITDALDAQVKAGGVGHE
jgi:hypothetical protein